MRRATLLVALWGLWATGCSPSRAPSSPGGTLGPSTTGVMAFQPGLFFAESRVGLAERRYITTANFGQLKELWIRTAVPAIGTTAPVKVSFITPAGSVFRVFHAVFATDPAIKKLDVPGNPYPLDVTTARALPGGYHLDFPVTIAGTPFTKFPQPGIWSLRADVVGATEAYASPLTVEVHR